MKEIRILLFGQVIDTSVGILGVMTQAQQALDSLIGNGLSVIVTSPSKNTFRVHVNRQYPEENQIDFANNSGVPLNDARILAGNYGKCVINFGYLPYADMFNYNLHDEDIKTSFNESADRLGFTKIKKMTWECYETGFDVELKY